MSRNQPLRNAVRLAIAANVGLAALGAAPGAAGQEAIEEVVVTGSRIVRGDLTANSPITIVDSDDFRYDNTTNLEEYLRDMPQFVAAVGKNANNGNDGSATVDLRNLGESRTLVLVNGKRFVPYDYQGFVDLNMIPVSLVERVEIVTGGASAVYGSDAVAGVVNFVMKDDFEGIQADVSYGASQEGDGDRVDFGLTMGGNIANGRGNMVVSFTYTDQEEVTQGQRDYSFEALGDDLQPFGSFTAPWGTIAGNFPDIDVDDNGLVQFDQAGNATIVGTADTFNFNPFNLLQVPQEKWTGTALASLDLNETVSAFGRLSFANSRVDTVIAPTGTFFFPFQLNLDNPFLSDQARDVLAAQDDDGDGLVDISFGRRLTELGTRDSLYENTAFQLVGGLEGSFAERFGWEVFAQVGRTSRTQNFINDVSFNAAQQAMLAVEDENGDIVCQDSSGGCVPANYFVQGGISPAAASFMRLNLNENNKTEQVIFGGSITGDTPLQLPTADAPLAFAVGAELRREDADNLPDSNYSGGNSIGFGSSSPVDAEFDVDELYAEASLPVIGSFLVEGGVRVAQYENSVGTAAGNFDNDFDNTSWKLMAEWAPLEMLRFRGGVQEAVRAPNLREIGLPLTPATGDLDNDPCEGDNPVGDQALTDLCVATGVPADQIGNVLSIIAGQINNFVGGNPQLEPEEADSLTVGAVFTPSGLPLTVAVDYFEIDIENAIEQISEQNIVNACYQTERDPNGQFCSLIARNPLTGGLSGGNETGVDVSLINAGTTTRRGIDFNVDYSLQLGDAGTLDLGLNAVHVLESTIQEASFLPENDCTGLVGNTCLRPEPEWRFIQNTRWTRGPVSVNLRWQFLDSVMQDAIALDGADPADFAVPRIGTQSYFDLSAIYQINDKTDVRLGVFNLLDEEPPIVGNEYGGTTENSGNTFPATYDPLGRYFTLGFNARF